MGGAHGAGQSAPAAPANNRGIERVGSGYFGQGATAPANLNAGPGPRAGGFAQNTPPQNAQSQSSQDQSRQGPSSQPQSAQPQSAQSQSSAQSQTAPSETAAESQTPPQKTPVVVELFTSQGCAACPPADKILGHLAERDDVIALALHVDYWDYLGWADQFGQPAFSARQKGYARAAKERMIYTPQLIVNGQQRLLGADRGAITTALASAKATQSQVQISISGGNGAYKVSLKADPPLSQDAMVQLVRYIPSAQMEILRGENAGLTMSYSNIVTAWHVAADWDGQTPMTLDMAVEGDDPAVVIVQTAQAGRSASLPGAIVGAGRLQ
ncbi:DUF1223 domain-containing protein [Rhodobacteraceae bacterium]|nr:DUF1223 domain-containing protein [Paracoccaceae bacterium]